MFLAKVACIQSLALNSSSTIMDSTAQSIPYEFFDDSFKAVTD